MKTRLLISVMAMACIALSGCESLQSFNEGSEATFQAVHLVDTLQTIHGSASDPCYGEGDPVTRRLIGERPSSSEVAAWGVGYAMVHYGVTRLLTENGFDKTAAVWEVATIADTVTAIGHNYSIGIRLGAPNKDPVGCDLPKPPELLTFHGAK